jgi:hypothetical protein
MRAACTCGDEAVPNVYCPLHRATVPYGGAEGCVRPAGHTGRCTVNVTIPRAPCNFTSHSIMVSRCSHPLVKVP